MKKSAKILFSVLLLVCLLLTVVGCGAKNDVSKLIDKFETACAELDTSAILDCMNPAIADPIRGVLDLLGVDDLDAVLSAIVEVIAFVDFKDAEPEEVLETLTIKPESYVFNDAEDECTVTASVTYVVEDEEVTDIVSFECILKDEVWYIAGLS